MGELVTLFVLLKNKTFFVYIFKFSSTAYFFFNILITKIQKSDTNLDKVNKNFDNQRIKGNEWQVQMNTIDTSNLINKLLQATSQPEYNTNSMTWSNIKPKSSITLEDYAILKEKRTINCY